MNKEIINEISEMTAPAIAGEITDSDVCCSCEEDLTLELYGAFRAGYEMAINDVVKKLKETK